MDTSGTDGKKNTGVYNEIPQEVVPHLLVGAQDQRKRTEQSPETWDARNLSLPLPKDES